MPEISRRAFGGPVGGGAVTAVAAGTSTAEAATAERPFRARTAFAAPARRPNLLALRRGDWKYYQDAAKTDHLCNLAADSREQADLAADRPALLAELKAAWERTAAGLLPYAD